jgi:hypothetical protein
LAFLKLLTKVGLARRASIQVAILSLRAATPVAMLLVARNAAQILRTPSALSPRRLLWYLLSACSVAEAIFLVYIVEYWRRLNAHNPRGWRAVLTHSTEEKRRASMERYLMMITQVCRGGSGSPADAGKLLPLTTPSTNGKLKRNTKLQAPSTSETSLVSKRGLFGVGSAGRMFSSGSLLGMSPSKREASVDDFLKLWEKGSHREPSNEALTDEEFRRLKILELAGWFEGPEKDNEAENPEAWLRRGNMEDWIAHYWFRGSTPEELSSRPNEYQELRQLVDLVLDFTGLTLPDGSARNPQIRARLMMSDKLPVVHRPLLCYVGTAVLVPLMTSQVMQLLGFRREKVGGLCYWHRGTIDGVRSEVDICGPRQAPMVVVHGLGVGLVPYYLFISRLSKRYSGELFVPEFPFMAMVPWETVPSAREVVAQVQDMLASNRHTSAHFVAHSFGCVIVSWMMKMSQSSILTTTFMEPASVVVFKSDFIGKVLWEPPKTAMDIFLRYFVFRELFTVNLLCRNSYWELATLWPEE